MERRICGRCGRTFEGYPAISRKDNATELCPECGALEAMEAAGMSEQDVAKMLAAFLEAGQ